MAGIYAPKRGKYAGRVFRSKREYVNTIARDEGYKSHEQRGEARKEQQELADVGDIRFKQTKDRKNSNVKIDIYEGNDLYSMIQYAKKLPPKHAISIIVKTNKSIGESKSNRNVEGYSTLIPTVKVSLFIKEMNNKDYTDRLDERLRDIDNIEEVILWVYR